MQLATISQVADWLEEHTTAISQRQEVLDTAKILQLLDELQILRQPLSNYWQMTEEEYYQNESDHQLTLQNEQQVLAQLHDRVLVNHVDGSFSKNELHFTYNHEDPYANQKYDVVSDLHTLEYGLEIIGAIQANTILADLRNNLSQDAVLSLGIAVHAVEQWQKN